jgi:hypothetical protein
LSRLLINVIIIILHWLLVYDSTTWEDVVAASWNPNRWFFTQNSDCSDFTDELGRANRTCLGLARTKILVRTASRRSPVTTWDSNSNFAAEEVQQEDDYLADSIKFGET